MPISLSSGMTLDSLLRDGKETKDSFVFAKLLNHVNSDDALDKKEPGHLFILHQDIPKHHNSTDPQSELTALNLAILKTLWLPDVEIR